MSVFKLHQALAVGDYCKKHQISFDTLLTVDSTDLQPNTYSPLRDRYPHGGKFSLKQLMEYTLHLSDNNACDILFKFTGGPAVTDVISVVWESTIFLSNTQKTICTET